MVSHSGRGDRAAKKRNLQFSHGQSTITNPDGGLLTTYFYDPHSSRIGAADWYTRLPKRKVMFWNAFGSRTRPEGYA